MVFEPNPDEIPITEDVLKKEIEFVKTWNEWSADNRDQIIRSALNTSASDVTLFTVPDRTTLFITSAFTHTLSLSLGAGGTAVSGIKNRNTFILGTFLTAVDIGNAGLTTNFSMPLKFQEKETILIDNADADKRTVAGFQGFLVPKRI